MTLAPTGFSPFTGSIGPLNRVTPFTHRDNATYLTILHAIVDYINNTLRPETDAELTRIIGEFQAGLDTSNAQFAAEITNVLGQFNTALDTEQASFNGTKADWDSRFNAFMADINNQLAALNDQAMAGVIGNALSQTAIALTTFVGKAQMNVKAYGAAGDGVTDDSAAVQAALNAVGVNGHLYFPPGTYLMRNVSGSGKSNVTLHGVKGASKLQYNRTGAGAVDALIGWNTAAAPAVNDRNIVIRDLTFLGAGTVSENQAQLHMSAIDNLLIENCEFLNMQGDGINIARTAVGGADTGVHNRNVRIVNNYFDGAYIGRNGVTVINAENLLITGNTFTRCAMANMPGAIDIEPNSFDTTAINNDIVIVNNVFKDNGGFSADIGISIVPAAGTQKRWEIAGNTFSGSKVSALFASWHLHPAVDTDLYLDMSFHDNKIGAPDASCAMPAIIVEGFRGFRIERNTVVKWPREVMRLGYDTNRVIKDAVIRANTFLECSAATGYVISLNVGDRVDIDGNNTTALIAPLSALVLVGGTGPTSNVSARGNIANGVAQVVSFGAGTTTPSSNKARGNIGFTQQAPEPKSFFGDQEKVGQLPAKIQTANYSMLVTDSMILGNSAGLAVGLPAVDLAPLGRVYTIKNMFAGNLFVTSSANIDGVNGKTLTQWQVGKYTSDGAQWLSV